MYFNETYWTNRFPGNVTGNGRFSHLTTYLLYQRDTVFPSGRRALFLIPEWCFPQISHCILLKPKYPFSIDYTLMTLYDLSICWCFLYRRLCPHKWTNCQSKEVVFVCVLNMIIAFFIPNHCHTWRSFHDVLYQSSEFLFDYFSFVDCIPDHS